MLNDPVILKKIKEGDIQAFEAVFHLYYSPLCLYAVGITGGMEAAKGIVQEVFYVFWKEREGIRIFHSIKNYLYGAVRNRSLQYCEHREVCSRHREAVLANHSEAASSDPQDLLEYKELQDIIMRALGKLPQRRLRIFRMHRFAGKKYEEIAAELSLSVKTIEAEMSKALQTLRKEVESYIHIV
ncbi:MAG: RNA polymerase sigma-70 factor [Tannerellaceae bacterium]|jgi:RNA polymerase sigma-70 factor (ECF subfamily)|nr:RNA polymerase sigma-70 factor [Tannerellaceae bacterium]